MQQVIDGFALGGVYALVALGLALIYRVMKFMQLAQGQLVTLGAYLGLGLSAVTGSLVLAMLGTLLAMAFVGWACERHLFRRVLGQGHLAPLMIALALGLIIQEVTRILVSNGNPVAYPVRLASDEALEIPGGLFIVPSQLATFIAGLVAVTAAHVVLRRTTVGMRIRAVAANPVAAELLGIDVGRVHAAVTMVSFSIAGALGVFLGSSFAYVSPALGNVIGDLALAAVLAAGLGSLAGILVTAFLIGIAESYTIALGWSSYVAMVPFVVIIAVLFLRPQGLFGTLSEARN
jgi:branched-chain amino acid transport system permease protein